MLYKRIILIVLFFNTVLLLNINDKNDSFTNKEEICYQVKATVYYIGNITASGFKLDTINPHKHKIIAVSRDLYKEMPFGTKVRIYGTGQYDGMYTVKDLMHSKWTNKIDILINKGMPEHSYSNIKICKYE